MKKLIIVRHGHYDYSEHLSDYGKEQISSMIDKLRPYIDGSKPLILSSTASRAEESAEILASAFGVPYEKYNILWSESNIPEDLPGTLELVHSRQQESDIVILVTHHEYAKYFPGYYAEKELGTEFSPVAIEKGEALVLDCERRRLTRIF